MLTVDTSSPVDIGVGGKGPVVGVSGVLLGPAGRGSPWASTMRRSVSGLGIARVSGDSTGRSLHLGGQRRSSGWARQAIQVGQDPRSVLENEVSYFGGDLCAVGGGVSH